MAIRILYQNEAEKSKSGDNDFFLLTNQICLYVGAALENEIYNSRGAECSKRAEVGHRRDSGRDKFYVDVR